MRDFTDDQNCFVCGEKNPVGLKLEFRENATSHETEADVVFPAYLQGWRDTVHGGLLATALDEVMVQAARTGGIPCVTAEITVKYKQPAFTGIPYVLAGRTLESRGRIILAEGRICDASGQIFAQATAKLFRMK